MVETGEQLDFKGIVADKHSIGGTPGARTTMIVVPVSYTHLRAHETVLDLVCRLLLEKKKQRVE